MRFIPALALIALALTGFMAGADAQERRRGEIPKGGTIYFVDRLVTGEKVAKEDRRALGKLDTLADAQSYLNAHAIPFRRETIELNSGYVDDQLADLLDVLRPNQVFVARDGEGGLSIGTIVGSRPTAPRYN